MYFRGRGRGGYRSVEGVPFKHFPEIEGLGTAEYSSAHIQLVRWSTDLHNDHRLSPYYHEDRSNRQKAEIQRYSDRQSQATKVKPPLWEAIHLDTDHMPAEIAIGGGVKRVKKFRWSADSEWNKLEELELKGNGGTEKKEDEDEEEEEEEGEKDEGEFSDHGDYDHTEYCDDDEDDFNMVDDNDDEPFY